MNGFMNPAEFANIANPKRISGGIAACARSCSACWIRTWRGRQDRPRAGSGLRHRLPFAPAAARARAGRLCRWISAAKACAMRATLGVEQPVQGDIRSLPFDDGAFDLVMSLDVIVASAARAKKHLAARELARVLAPGGLLVVRTSALDILRSRHCEFACERQRFTRRRLMGLFAGTGIRVLRCTYANSLLMPVALAKFRLWEPLMRQAAGERRGAGGAVARPAAVRAAGAGGRVARRGTELCPAGQSLVLIGEKMLLMCAHAEFPSLSVFFPAYNDAPSLPELLAQDLRRAGDHVEDYEVIVVNDGSYDDTAEVLEQLRATVRPRLRVVTHPRESRLRRRAAQRPRSGDARSSSSTPMATASTTWANCRACWSWWARIPAW